ncbi:MAG: phenylalanine--tRNA ligase subunit beta [Paracoccaceae bacterium]
MKFSFSWLKDYLDTDLSADEVGDVLTDTGLEVESLIDPRKPLGQLSVGEILRVEKHPNADKLKVCEVNSSIGILNIVCGAPNVKRGMKVVVAKPGDFIPGLNVNLKASKIRDVKSEGMMCSERELEISDEHEGIIELPSETEVGTLFSDLVGDEKTVFEIAITPNRPDALGIYGIARDLSASGVGNLRIVETPNIEGSFKTHLTIDLESEVSSKECPFFLGRHFRGVENGESPDWLKKRLIGIGLNPISALVDITNYLTFDRGRPLHVFDADKLSGGLTVRKSVKGETFHALDDKIYELTEGMIVITDEKEIVSLGGIIGGMKSAVSDKTKNVLLEAAYFDPISIASTGRKLQINSDARYRFERGVDPSFTLPGSHVATKMILDLCGGQVSDTIIAGSEPPFKRKIIFNPKKVNQLIGIEVNNKRQIEILNSLGFLVKTVGPNFEIIVPSWRPDIYGEVDIIEEVARINSLANLPSIPMARKEGVSKPLLTDTQSRQNLARRVCASLGYIECLSYSFIDKKSVEQFSNNSSNEITLINPISSEMTHMRQSLIPGLLKIVEKNHAKGMKNLAIFEQGYCFESNQVGDETYQISAVLLGSKTSVNLYKEIRSFDIFDIKRDLFKLLSYLNLKVDNIKLERDTPKFLHPKRSAKMLLGSKLVAIFGEVNPLIAKNYPNRERINCFTLYLDNIPFPKKRKITRDALILNNLQPIERDFSFLIDEKTEYGAIKRAIISLKNPLIDKINIVDVFQGEMEREERKKSLSIRVKFQPLEKTLNDAEIEKMCAHIISEVGEKVNGILKS